MRYNRQELHATMVARTPPRHRGMLPLPGAHPLPSCGPPSAKLLRVATEDDDEDIPGIERLLALTDGVVAIALTLLVLQLQVPGHATCSTKNPDSALGPVARAAARRRGVDQLPGLLRRHRPVLDRAPPRPARHARAQRGTGVAQLRLPARPHADAVHLGPDRPLRQQPGRHHPVRAQPGGHQPEHAVDLPLRRRATTSSRTRRGPHTTNGRPGCASCS